jgi:hypothetical protein
MSIVSVCFPSKSADEAVYRVRHRQECTPWRFGAGHLARNLARGATHLKPAVLAEPLRNVVVAGRA